MTAYQRVVAFYRSFPRQQMSARELRLAPSSVKMIRPRHELQIRGVDTQASPDKRLRVEAKTTMKVITVTMIRLYLMLIYDMFLSYHSYDDLFS